MSSRISLGFSAALTTVTLGYLYFDSLVFLFKYWIGSDDYSHGIFVPLISLFLIWQARHRLAATDITSSWWGLLLISMGVVLYGVGELAALFVILHISLWLMIVGLVISLTGIQGARIIAFPLTYLLTSIPLPGFLYAGLSSQLQLWSSALGVGVLQLVGVTAFREGNVIDLGPVQLQVVEACSGIRYLLPLTSLALLCAYLFKDRMWKRVLLVFSSIPISILVNGFRIGMIGVLVEWDGPGAAEGFSHLFEGWVLFMASFGLLILEMWYLANVGVADRSVSLRTRFSWADPFPTSAAPIPARTLSAAYLCSLALLIPVAIGSTLLVAREEVQPKRAQFVDFPMQLEAWHGAPMALEQQYIDALRFDDYLLADYRIGEGLPVTLYSAYYQSQRKGRSAHSPQSCLPGGGWEIASLQKMNVPAGPKIDSSFQVNRAVIQKDSQKQIVMYWFKQRDRILTNEYLVKAYLLWDALSKDRTDGALIRIASLVGPGETEDATDQRLLRFATVMEQELTRYVPD